MSYFGEKFTNLLINLDVASLIEKNKTIPRKIGGL